MRETRTLSRLPRTWGKLPVPCVDGPFLQDASSANGREEGLSEANARRAAGRRYRSFEDDVTLGQGDDALLRKMCNPSSRESTKRAYQTRTGRGRRVVSSEQSQARVRCDGNPLLRLSQSHHQGDEEAGDVMPKIIWCFTRRPFRMLETSGDGTIRGNDVDDSLQDDQVNAFLMDGTTLWFAVPCRDVYRPVGRTQGLTVKYEVAQPKFDRLRYSGLSDLSLSWTNLSLDPASGQSLSRVCWLHDNRLLFGATSTAQTRPLQRHSHVSSTEFCRERSMAFVPCPPPAAGGVVAQHSTALQADMSSHSFISK